jgi:hypothetical protein
MTSSSLILKESHDFLGRPRLPTTICPSRRPRKMSVMETEEQRASRMIGCKVRRRLRATLNTLVYRVLVWSTHHKSETLKLKKMLTCAIE